MCCVCVDHGGQRRTYEDPRRFVKWLASLLGREQEGGEERALDEFLKSILGQPHELLLCQPLPVGKAGRGCRGRYERSQARHHCAAKAASLLKWVARRGRNVPIGRPISQKGGGLLRSAVSASMRASLYRRSSVLGACRFASRHPQFATLLTGGRLGVGDGRGG